jgi:hypothetical protein
MAEDVTRPRDESPAAARKERTHARLRKLGIPINDGLPPPDADDHVRLREPVEVARRAEALWVVAARGEGMPAARALEILADAGIPEALTPRERRFLDDPQPQEQDLAAAVRKYECLWVLLWALGHVPAADRLDRRCDVGAVVRILVSHTVDDLAGGRPRPAAEVLDVADFVYRCHWAVTNARAHGQPPPSGLVPEVTSERHHALTWLTRRGDRDWDDADPPPSL